MSKKWIHVGELQKCIFEDDTLEKCHKNLKKITYAPNLGYYAWIFRYKGTLVSLWDKGNSHWDFYSAVNYIDVFMAKITKLIWKCRR